MPDWILHLEHVPTPTGPMVIVTDEHGRLHAVDWQEREERVRLRLRRSKSATTLRLTQPRPASMTKRALEAYFEGELDAIAGLRTATGGTDFQRAVWAALRRIPPGCTLSYGALAARLGRPAAVRAVGLANGANPVAIVVPCHRVIGADASLVGYGGGLERKRWLLEHEGAIPSRRPRERVATRGSRRAAPSAS